MAKFSIKSKTASYNQQRGIATVLVVVLVGIALTATSLGLLHSIRNSQEKQVAVHAATNAQLGAWAGAEAFRSYLSQMDVAGIEAMAGEFNINFAGDYGNITARNINVTLEGDIYKVAADIVNVHPAARASSALGVVYAVSALDCQNCIQLEVALDFHDDLDVGGDIDFTPPSGQKTRINIDGNLTAMSVNMRNVSSVYATGAVNLHSAVNVEEIYSNLDVDLGGAAWADKVTTRGNVITRDGAGAGIVWANQNVTLGGSLISSYVNSRAHIQINSGGHGDFKTGGTIEAAVTGGSAVLNDLKAVGDITITNNALVVNDIVGEGNVNCPNPGWTSFNSISINGTLSGCTNNATELARTTQNASNVIDVMEEVAPVEIPRMVVDVWTLKEDANYVFQWDSAKNATKVSVKNINGITDGDYYIGDYSGPAKSYICEEVNSSGACTAPASPIGAICIGHSLYNSCLSYDVASEKWTFNGTSAAPGIMWFEGNVLLDNGYNYTTILATGNVSTGGQFRGVSLNYGGYEGTCRANGPGIPSSMKPYYTALFLNRYPTQLCDIGAGEYISKPIGNIAIAAGGYNPDDSGAYSGGDVSLGASNEVYGSILAGGYLETGGSTRVFGYVTAAAQGVRGSKDNALGGNTQIDLTHSNDDYDPTIVPDMTNGACPDCEGLGPDSAERSRILWSRYL